MTAIFVPIFYRTIVKDLKDLKVPNDLNATSHEPCAHGGVAATLPDRASSAFSRVVERSETHGKESTAPMFPQGIISEPLNDS